MKLGVFVWNPTLQFYDAQYDFFFFFLPSHSGFWPSFKMPEKAFRNDLRLVALRKAHTHTYRETPLSLVCAFTKLKPRTPVYRLSFNHSQNTEELPSIIVYVLVYSFILVTALCGWLVCITCLDVMYGSTSDSVWKACVCITGIVGALLYIVFNVLLIDNNVHRGGALISSSVITFAFHRCQD